MKPVVGAAIVDGGRVLACRRTHPAEAAGRWEFPGGKVESGETPENALRREIAEELGCRIEVVSWLPGATRIGETHELRVALSRVVTGTPTPLTHDRLRWLTAAELDQVDWLEPDRPFVDALRRMGGPSTFAPLLA